jgi:hypothetical protein
MLEKIDIEKVRIKKISGKSIWSIEYQEKIYGDERLRSNLWTFWKFDSAYSEYELAEKRANLLLKQKYTMRTATELVFQVPTEL